MSEPPAPQPSPGRPAPGPRHAATAPVAAARHPRRWFLAGTGAAVLAAGGGVGAAFVRQRHTAADASRAAPAQLTAAVAAERALLADLSATTGGTPAVRQVLVRARADHTAHLQALVALLQDYDDGTAVAGPVGTPRTVAQLRAAEEGAARRAAAGAASLDGASAPLATVLASIAACEATHAALLT